MTFHDVVQSSLIYCDWVYYSLAVIWLRFHKNLMSRKHDKEKVVAGNTGGAFSE